MRVFTTILGLIAGVMLAILLCKPIYRWIWPRATDFNQGGPGYFLVLVLAPSFMIVGAIAGSIAGASISSRR